MKTALSFLAGAIALAPASWVSASTIISNVDSLLPNAIDSWSADDFYASATGGPMTHGQYPGTSTIDPADAITADPSLGLGEGKRLFWLFWVPGVTVQDLENGLQLRGRSDWGGTEYFGLGASVDIDPNFWLQAKDWARMLPYTDSLGVSGVVGGFGDSWYVDGISYSSIGELATDVFAFQTYWQGEFRLNGDEIAGPLVTIAASPVPAPGVGAAGLVVFGLLGTCTGLRRRRCSRA